MKGNKNMYKYNVWVPTGEMMCYTVESETPLSDNSAKKLLLEQIDGEREWNDYDDQCYVDVTMADWEVEDYKN